MYLFPYKMGSQGCKNLAQALGIKRIRKQGKFKGRPNKLVINWGNAADHPEVAKCQVLNPPAAVNKAGNKLLAFQAMEKNDDIHIPRFTQDREEAEGWVNDGYQVVARTVLRGHSGEGIVLVSNVEEMVDAPLYVQYIRKIQEYRVHVFQGKPFDVQRKARRKDVDDDNVNWQVRNHHNGFIFAREGVELPEAALNQAVLAVEALGLDFGAVDLIYNKQDEKYFVLEINTAPGLTGTTLENYTEVFNGIGAM